jgi:ABC-2 type transport system permease protein
MNEIKVDVPIQSGFSLYWTVVDSWRLAKRSMLHVIRSFDQVMSLVMFPVMFMLLNRYVLGGAIESSLPPGVDYVNYLFAGVLIQTLAFGANYTTINIAVDLKDGIVDRFRSLPMSNSAFIVGHVTADLFRNLVSAVIILVVGFIIGFRPNSTLMEWLGVIGLAIALTLAISWLSAILGLLVNSLEAAQWMGFIIIFPLTFISSAFVPTDTMPPGLQAFAENQPLTLVINQTREWLVDVPTDTAVWVPFAWCIATVIVCVPITAALFRKKTQ